MAVFHFIYETKNLVNGKKYIGKHSTDNIDDGYIGSGVVLNNAIKKYGKSNFYRTIIHWCENEKELNAKETEFITDAVVHSADYYNIGYGGQGGCIILNPKNPRYSETCEKISKSAKAKSEFYSITAKKLHCSKIIGMYGRRQSEHQKMRVSNALKGKKHSKEHIENQRESLLKTISDPNYVNPNTGKRLSEETKKKISMNHSDVSGENNPMFGCRHSDETKKKISEAAASRKKVRCSDCGRLITESQLPKHKKAKHDTTSK